MIEEFLKNLKQTVIHYDYTELYGNENPQAELPVLGNYANSQFKKQSAVLKEKLVNLFPNNIAVKNNLEEFYSNYLERDDTYNSEYRPSIPVIKENAEKLYFTIKSQNNDNKIKDIEKFITDTKWECAPGAASKLIEISNFADADINNLIFNAKYEYIKDLAAEYLLVNNRNDYQYQVHWVKQLVNGLREGYNVFAEKGDVYVNYDKGADTEFKKFVDGEFSVGLAEKAIIERVAAKIHDLFPEDGVLEISEQVSAITQIVDLYFPSKTHDIFQDISEDYKSVRYKEHNGDKIKELLEEQLIQKANDASNIARNGISEEAELNRAIEESNRIAEEVRVAEENRYQDEVVRAIEESNKIEAEKNAANKIKGLFKIKAAKKELQKLKEEKVIEDARQAEEKVNLEKAIGASIKEGHDLKRITSFKNYHKEVGRSEENIKKYVKAYQEMREVAEKRAATKIQSLVRKSNAKKELQKLKEGKAAKIAEQADLEKAIADRVARNEARVEAEEADFQKAIAMSIKEANDSELQKAVADRIARNEVRVEVEEAELNRVIEESRIAEEAKILEEARVEAIKDYSKTGSYLIENNKTVIRVVNDSWVKLNNAKKDVSLYFSTNKDSGTKQLPGMAESTSKLIDAENTYLQKGFSVAHGIFNSVNAYYNEDFTPIINSLLYTTKQHTNVLKSDNAFVQCGIDVTTSSISQLVTFNLYGAATTAGLTVAKCVAPAALSQVIDAAQSINNFVNTSNPVIKTVEVVKLWYTAVDNPHLIHSDTLGMADDL